MALTSCGSHDQKRMKISFCLVHTGTRVQQRSYSEELDFSIEWLGLILLVNFQVKQVPVPGHSDQNISFATFSCKEEDRLARILSVMCIRTR